MTAKVKKNQGKNSPIYKKISQKKSFPKKEKAFFLMLA
jgi:predicted DNA-binding transcriptional regulator AlpA